MTSRKQTGFTIVELLIVIVIIGILAAITIVAYNGIQNRGNDATVQSDLRQTYSKIQAHIVLNDAYPTTWPEINSVFVTTRKAYGGGLNSLIYCRSSTASAIVGRSVSGNGFAYSSNGGAMAFASWPGDSNVNLCPAAGIPTASPGYAATWIRVNGVWDPSFTVGA